MLLRSALMFGPFDRRRNGLTEHKEAARAALVSDLLPKVVSFEMLRMERVDRAISARGLPKLLDRALLYVIEDKEPAETLRFEDLMEIGRRVTGRPDLGLRIEPLPASPGRAGLAPAAIPSALTRLFEWLQSPAFSELHPVEQMTVCQLRLFEIAPFPAQSDTIAACFSYLVLHRSVSLLPEYEPHELGEFHSAIEDGWRFDTSALVRLNLQACERACHSLLKRIESA